jgi:hypothetical protein
MVPFWNPGENTYWKAGYKFPLYPVPTQAKEKVGRAHRFWPFEVIKPWGAQTWLNRVQRAYWEVAGLDYGPGGAAPVTTRFSRFG